MDWQKEVEKAQKIIEEKNHLINELNNHLSQKTHELDRLRNALNQAKTELLIDMHHNIRTPLSSIVGFAEIMKAESNELHIKEYADNLLASSHALLDFMDELAGEICGEMEEAEEATLTDAHLLSEDLLDNRVEIDEKDWETERSYTHTFQQQSIFSQVAHDPAGKHLVLVVEDNPTAQKVAQLQLTTLNCIVDVASCGLEALNLFKNKKYDLIFMDIGLNEEMNGIEVSRQIRKLSHNLPYIPIIALTAQAGEENKQACIEAGMDAVLSKPLTKIKATDIIKAFISNRFKPSLQSSNHEQFRLDLPKNDEELFALTKFPLLDVKEAIINGTDKNFLVELLASLVNEDLPKEFIQMRQAFAKKDFELVQKIAHKIKGGTVYVGTIRLKYACQYLERYWKIGERKLFEKLYTQALQVINDTITYVENWLSAES